MDTTVLLKNEDMVGLASTGACIEAIENAYLELGRGNAEELPRRRIYHPRDDRPEHYYWFNEMAGIVPNIRSMGLRVNSAAVAVSKKRGNARLGFPGAFSLPGWATTLAGAAVLAAAFGGPLSGARAKDSVQGARPSG